MVKPTNEILGNGNDTNRGFLIEAQEVLKISKSPEGNHKEIKLRSE